MYLYLLYCSRLALTKIGISKSPTRRCQRVNRGQLGVKLLKFVKVSNAQELEKGLHKRFDNERVKRSELPTCEWFALNKLQVLNLMRELDRL